MQTSLYPPLPPANQGARLDCKEESLPDKEPVYLLVEEPVLFPRNLSIQQQQEKNLTQLEGLYVALHKLQFVTHQIMKVLIFQN